MQNFIIVRMLIRCLEDSVAALHKGLIHIVNTYLHVAGWGVRPTGPPTGKSFRFVSCVRARGGGEVGFGWFWDSTAQCLSCVLLGF